MLKSDRGPFGLIREQNATFGLIREQNAMIDAFQTNSGYIVTRFRDPLLP